MNTSTCSIPDCTRPPKARSWCIGHYNRWWRTGDTGPADLSIPAGTAHHNWSGSDVGYKGAHSRVVSLHGRAKQHTCRGCGATAQAWAYNHQDPDEKFDERGRPYSLKPEHYEPLCYVCHRRQDLAAAKARSVR